MKALKLAAIVGMFATAAPAVTLDFSGNICNGGGACGTAAGSSLDQTYGDITGVDVTYDGDTSTAALESVLVWGTGYEEFSNAIWTSQNLIMSIMLEAQTGYEVSLTSLGIAPYDNRDIDTQVRIVDLATNADIYNTSFTSLSTGGSTLISHNATSAAGFQIFFGPDAYNAGIGSLTYDAQVISVVNPVPLPAAGWMLLAGLGGLGFAKRKRG